MWIRALERIFNVLHCTDRERLTCVAFQLVGSADFWWETQRRIMPPDQLENMTWAKFKDILYDRYIPESYRKAKEHEFYNLKEGKMSVTNYDRAFNDMSRYAPELVNTDAKKATRFCDGLRHEIRLSLAGHDNMTYALVLKRALKMEAALTKERVQAPQPPQQQ